MAEWLQYLPNLATSPREEFAGGVRLSCQRLKSFKTPQDLDIMLSATRASKLDHYKLETTFHADQTVTHTTYKADLAAGERKTAVRTKWTEKRKLGSGGFGIVVLQESESGQLRAVKKLPQGLGKIDYSREVKVLSKVADVCIPWNTVGWEAHCNYFQRQDHFVLFFGWYENRDFVFIAMEYIEHGDLSQYLKSPDSRPNAREITRQLLEGLTILHDKKICHRDLKPQVGPSLPRTK